MSPSSACADRNLVFGILALQMDFISRDALIAALHAWVLDKSKSLGEVLVAQGVLSRERNAVLEALLLEHLKEHGNDPQQSLAAIQPTAEVRQQLHHIADPDVQASLVHVPATPSVDNDPEATRAKACAPTSSEMRFRIVRPHAKGGLGEVFVARDEELHREVALKEIQERHADHPESRTRFVREAEITGGLEHPGIVPVYGLGQYGDGRPFYAMRLIQGESLKEAIDRFHQADVPGRDPGERILELRKLLDRFRAVCNTIAYAHSRGVLHRDLKPANIMLGPFGETLVVDWGLARLFAPEPEAQARVGSPREPEAQARANGKGTKDLPLPPMATMDDADLTRTGQALGTPAFMSPEQAAGRLDLLSPASDIYSLGATLYYLLTGEAPFSGSDLGALLGKVQHGEFPPPGRKNAHIPRPLEAICLRAMALQPAERYGSARELAGELEHWLADEPVHDYVEPWSGRLRRWARKHRGTTATAAGLLALLATVAIAWGLIEEARRSEQLAVNRKAIETGLREQLDQVLYINRVNRAYQAWRNNDVEQANQQLEECPKQLRHWEWGHVRRLCHDHLLTIVEHNSSFNSVAFSPDGKQLATASWRDETVKLWDAATGQVTRTLQGHTEVVDKIVFSPDGKRLATASHDKTVKLWDPATGQVTRTLQVIGASPYRVIFSPDGKRLATTGFFDKTVKVWDVATGQVTHTLQGHTGHVNSVVFSPDGKWLASASEDKTVKLWDAATGQVTRTLQGHTEGVGNVVFSPDGNRLATASVDQMKVWDTATGRETRALQGIDPHSVVFSPDGTRLATIRNLDGTVQLWDVATGQETHTLQGHTGRLWNVVFSPDSKQLAASAPDDKTVKLWDAVTGQVTRTLQGHTTHVFSVVFSPDGKRLATASEQQVHIWDSSREEMRTLQGHTEGVSSVVFSPDGKRLASASLDKTVKLWDTATGHETLTLRGHLWEVRWVVFSPDGKRLATASSQEVKVWDAATGQESPTLQGRMLDVYSVVFSPDGKRLASASQDKTVKVWDAATGQESLTLQGHRDFVRSVVFSPDGKQLASASQDKTVKVWDAATGLERLTLQGHMEVVWSVVFSPDGKRLASASGNQVKVWDVATGQESLTLQGRMADVTRVVFSPDGKRLATTSFTDRPVVVKIWDAATGQETLTLQGHTDFVSTVVFSPDGKRLASASWDKTVKLWDTATGYETLTLQGHTGHVNRVVFSPEGKRLASASSDGTVKVWEAMLWP